MNRVVAAATESRPGSRPVCSQSMTVPSQLSLGTKQRHNKSRAERKGRGERMVLVTPALSQGLLDELSAPSHRREVSLSVALEDSYSLQMLWRKE